MLNIRAAVEFRATLCEIVTIRPVLTQENQTGFKVCQIQNLSPFFKHFVSDFVFS